MKQLGIIIVKQIRKIRKHWLQNRRFNKKKLNTCSELWRAGYHSHSLSILIRLATHYEKTPMQYTEIFKVVKNENFQ